MLAAAVDDFFHARLAVDGCRKAAMIRMGFAVLFLYDRFVSSGDYNFLQSPSRGVLPFWAGRDHASIVPGINWTVLSFFPESDAFLWMVYWIGQVQAMLLFLGIAPRLQLIGLFVNIVSMENHNALTRDGEDDMSRLWCFMLFFLPLHYGTVYDVLGSNKTDKTDDKKEQQQQDDKDDYSWPMWPFRMWQIYVCFIFIGAGFGKLDGPHWWPDGIAIFHLMHTDFYYPGLWNPHFIFNRLLPLKIICWSALIFELVSPITIWIPALRSVTLIGAVLLHVGIDITMHMHIFEWLTLLGWYTFTVQPDLEATAASKKPGLMRRLLDTVVVLTFITATAIDTLPIHRIFNVAPATIKPFVARVGHVQNVARAYISLPMEVMGIEMGPWDMYDGADPENVNTYFDAIIVFDDDSRQQTIWRSPDWMQMTWWQRHRAIRPMNYFQSLAGWGSHAAWVTLCRHLAIQYGLDKVHSVTLRTWDEVSGDLPSDIDPWDYTTPIKQPMFVQEKRVLVTLQVCKDLDDQCAGWIASSNGRECRANPAFMRKTCPKSCGFCEYLIEFEHIPLNYEWKYNDGPFQVARIINRHDDDDEEDEYEEYDDEYEDGDWSEEPDPEDHDRLDGPVHYDYDEEGVTGDEL